MRKENECKKTKYTLKIYITNLNLGKIILGQNFIIKNPEILCKILMAKHLNVKNSNKTCNTIFNDVITPNKLYQIQKHAITTAENKIVRECNGRFPVHLEKEIDLKIEQLLKTGVNINTNSIWNSRLVPVRKKDGSLRLCVNY